MNFMAGIFTTLLSMVGVSSNSIQATSVSWSGLDWTVRTNEGQPGPNCWSSKNVWVDQDGYLNLRISTVDGIVCSASVSSKSVFKNGTYTWVVEGPLTSFDENIVLGLFQYPVGMIRNGTDEIDIEVAQWGNSKNPNLNYTVWPAQLGPEKYFKAKSSLLAQAEYTFTFQRTNGRVDYFGPRWFMSGPEVTNKEMPVKMNLWLFQGARNYKRDIVVRIKSFTFIPE